MSDNEDLLADDLGDHSLADYNLGNDEEDQLLADDYESGPQNVPTSIDPNYNDGSDISSSEFSGHVIAYSQEPLPYQPPVEECVVPNITVEVPNTPIPDHSTYAPYEPPAYEPEHAVVPPAIPAAPIESPQIVPSELPNGDNRERFLTERPPGAQRTPQLRDIPDSLDKVFVPRGGYGGRGRTSWRSPQFQARYQHQHQPFNHPYRRHNVQRGHFLQQRPSFPAPQVRPNPPPVRPEHRPEQIRPDIRPDQIRPDIRHEPIRPDIRLEQIRPEIRREQIHPDIRREQIRPDIRHEPVRPDIRPDNRPEPRPEMRPEPIPMRREISPERPMIQEPFRPMENRPPFQNFQRFPFRPNMEEPRPNFGPMRPNPEPRFFQRPPFNPRFDPPAREIIPNSNHMPQITIRQPLPGLPLPANVPKLDEFGPKGPVREPEVRMLPVPMPPLPGALAGKKVLINPHFKGNFQPPVEATMRAGLGLPTYIPTRIQKSPPLSPTLENKFGPIKDIDDAAERFIAEQRNALARAANRKFPRRSPQRYIENTTIEIENELAPPPGAWRDSDDDLLRRQEEFINANRQGLRRRDRERAGPAPGRVARQRRRPAAAAGGVHQRQPPGAAASVSAPHNRYIENTTIEIENELAPPPGAWRDSDDDLLRRQEEFINANRQGLRRRMRSVSPPRRSPSPRRSPERRRAERAEPRRPPDEESEYRRRVREQESLRERVLRAKEVRRRKNAVALHKQLQDKERERNEPKDSKPEPKPDTKPAASPDKPSTTRPELDKPDTTRSSPERIENVEQKRERSPVKEEAAEVNSTCENLTPPPTAAAASPERALTPPLPEKKVAERRYSEDDDLAFILGDIDDMLSDDEDSGRFKEKPAKPEPVVSKPAADLRSKLPPRPAARPAAAARPPRQKIVFTEDKPQPKKRRAAARPPRQKIVLSKDKPQQKMRREKSPSAKKPAVTSSTKVDTETLEKKVAKPKPAPEVTSNKSRQRIIFENKELERDEDKTKPIATRRVVLQRKVTTTTKEKSVFSRIEVNDPSKPNPGIFSRAVRTAIGSDKPRIVIKRDEPEIEYESESDDEDRLLNEETGLVAAVTNLPHGITDTRLKTLAGSEVQNLILDKEERSAKITFKTTVAAGAFRKKFNNKMVAASRLTVTLR